MWSKSVEVLNPVDGALAEESDGFDTVQEAFDDALTYLADN